MKTCTLPLLLLFSRLPVHLVVRNKPLSIVRLFRPSVAITSTEYKFDSKSSVRVVLVCLALTWRFLTIRLFDKLNTRLNITRYPVASFKSIQDILTDLHVSGDIPTIAPAAEHTCRNYNYSGIRHTYMRQYHGYIYNYDGVSQ